MAFNLGIALNAAGQPVEGARAFQRAIAINPEFAPAHQNLGVFFESRGQFAEAITHPRLALKLSSDYADLRALLRS
jgi:tetratricopeptide (TPR) repeat protein